MKLDNKTYLKIDVQADLSSKKTAVFNFYTAKNGVVTKFDMGIPTQMSGISIKNKEGMSIEVMMKQQQDSVALSFAVDGRVIESDDTKELYDIIPRRTYMQLYSDGDLSGSGDGCQR